MPSLCDEPPVQRFFERTLVILNYIHPFYETIPFLRDLYGFPHLVVYGDQQHGSHPGVIPYDQSGSRVQAFAAWSGGQFAYRAVLDAAQRFPEYEGYLFVMDDVFLHPLWLTRHHLHHPWLTNDGWEVMDVFQPAPSSWMWWSTDMGLANCRAVWPRLPAVYQERLRASFACPHACVSGPSDVFYLPASYREAFGEVFHLLSEHEVFLEIAVPTGINAIADYIEGMDVKMLWDAEQKLDWPSHLDFCSDGLHPVKLSSESARQTLRELVDL